MSIDQDNVQAKIASDMFAALFVSMRSKSQSLGEIQKALSSLCMWIRDCPNPDNVEPALLRSAMLNTGLSLPFLTSLLNIEADLGLDSDCIASDVSFLLAHLSGLERKVKPLTVACGRHSFLISELPRGGANAGVGSVLWPASQKLVEHLDDVDWCRRMSICWRDARVAELGAGCSGLVGIAVSKFICHDCHQLCCCCRYQCRQHDLTDRVAGCQLLVLSDFEDSILPALMQNVTQNGIQALDLSVNDSSFPSDSKCVITKFDWTSVLPFVAFEHSDSFPSAALPPGFGSSHSFDIVFAADAIYSDDHDSCDGLVASIHALLKQCACARAVVCLFVLHENFFFFPVESIIYSLCRLSFNLVGILASESPEFAHEFKNLE
jgi:hypothetical protein